MSSRWVMHAFASAVMAVGLTSVAAVAAPAPGPVRAHAAKDDDKAKDDKGKDEKSKDDKRDKGGDDGAPAATPATPAAPTGPAGPAAPATPATPAPGGKDKDAGKDKDKGKPSTATPAPTAGRPAAPGVLPPATGVSATPSVAFDTPLLSPTQSQSVGVAAASGTVRIRTADGRDVHAVDAAAAIPTGAHVDARDGAVELTSAVAGGTQTATFSGAIFEVHQPVAGQGLTQIVLSGGDFSRCRATASGATAHAAVARKRKPRGKPVRSLWGKDDHGRFQTRGKGAVGTVRGTRWLTADYCNGTLTRVAEGAVAVYDRGRHRTVVVHAGHSYFAATA